MRYINKTISINNQNQLANVNSLVIDTGYFFNINTTLSEPLSNNVKAYLFMNNGIDYELTNITNTYGTSHTFSSDFCIRDSEIGYLEIWDQNNVSSQNYNFLGIIRIISGVRSIYG